MHDDTIPLWRRDREVRPDSGQSSRKRTGSLAQLHTRLVQRLDEFLARGDIWLLYRRDYPFVVFRSQPLFDDALELSADGRRAICAIASELSDFPGIRAQVTGHIDPCSEGPDRGRSSSYEAYLRARCVEDLLVETGVYPTRVLSAGIVRCDADDDDEQTVAGPMPGPPFVITICFTVDGDEFENARSWDGDHTEA